MNRHNSHQQPETTADNANADQWQVEQGSQASQTAWASAEAQPTGIEMVKQISPESVLDIAVDAIESSAREKQVERQLGLISEIMDDQEASKRDKHIRLDQLVENDEINLRDGKVLDQYLRQSMNTIDNSMFSSNYKILEKSQEIISGDRIDLSNPELARVYIDACADGHFDVGDGLQIGDFYMYYPLESKKFASSDQQTISYCLDHIRAEMLKESYDFDLLEESGIPLKQIVANKHIQDVAIEMMDDAVANVVRDGNKDGTYDFYTLSSNVPVDILSQICSSEESKKRVVESIEKAGMSVQEFGEVLIDDNVVGSFKEGYWINGLYWDGDRTAKCVDLMKNLGWHTAIGENDESLDRITELSWLGANDRVIKMQSEAYKGGVLDSKTVDQMYLREYSRLYDVINGINGSDCHAKLGRSVVSPDLIPSGDNPTVNYWHEQSKRHGADAMYFCMERIFDAAKEGNDLDIAELINEKGIMRDKFFQNYPGSLLWDVCATKQRDYGDYDCTLRSLGFLEAHQDQTSEMDGSKATIKLLSKMRDEDGRYDAEAVRLFRESMGSICINNPEELFDGDELTDKFYSTVFMRCYCNKDTDKFMSYIDSDWKDHYGDAGRKYLELVSTYPDSGYYVDIRKRQWIEKYLDAGGPVNGLANGILCDAYDQLEYVPAEKIPNEWQKLRSFCETYSYRMDGLGGATNMESILIGDLTDYFDANGPTDKLIDKILFNDIKFIYDYPELQADLSDDKKSMVRFCDGYDLDNSHMRKYGVTPDSLTDYFDANGPTDKLIDKILFNDIKFIYDYPELQADLSDDKKSMVGFCSGYNLDNSHMRKYGVTPDNLTDYFDANGPKPKFWQDAFASGAHDLDLIYKYYQNQDEAGKKRMGLDDKQIAVAKGYGSISEGDDWNDSRNLFESYVREHYDELTAEQIKWTASIMARLANSNASELADRSEAFTRELLKLDTDKIPEALDKIEDVYIHNHLPYVGKNYLVFRTMHPSPNLEDDFYFNNSRISPVLQQATGDLKSGKLDQMLNSRDAIIVSDLLRASLGSNNRSIREYLTTLKNGQALFDRLNAGDLDWSVFNQPTSLMDKETKANYDTLSTFAWHLATIYNSTLLGKEHPYQLVHQQVNQQSDTEELSTQPNSLQTDFTNLTSLIKPNSRYSLADRSVRYFAHFVGINSLADAEQYMDNIVKEADARNRKTAEYLATTKEPKLQPGDLVKGMGGTDGYGIRYLSYAFQNGSISKEYLGDASRSDTTPLDADASIVLDLLNGEQTINQVMASMLADGYGGGLWVVLRPDKERFIITRRDKREADQSVYDLSVPDASFDRTNLTQEEIDRRLEEIAEAKRHRREGLPKLEIFATGVDGDGHYGVRTGFGMNLVDYCVTDSTRIDSTPVSEVTKLEIALGGFYIPIIDRDSEELVFTPADYDKMREQMSGLSYYRTGDYQFAPDSELELDELTLDREYLSAVSAPSSSSTSDDAQGASSSSITIPSTNAIIDQLPTSMAETDRKHEVINQAIKQAITNIPELNLSYKDYLDGDLTENIVEMIDTGSTGRQTNAPGSGDFDYLARLDRSILNDSTKKQQITDALLTAFGKADEVNGTSNQIDNLDHNEDGEGEGEAGQVNNKSRIVNGNLRLKQVSIDGLAEPVDIDITFAQKTNKVQYPTDAALADRLSNIKNQSETKYQQVLANIIYAKQFLKAAGAYKPRRSPEAEGVGGLGGVGIENWVLQHGGSFKQAARDFLAVADSCSSFEDFCAHYPVWDYGENHKGIRSKPHDNFVADNMNPEGYERMKEVLREVVS